MRRFSIYAHSTGLTASRLRIHEPISGILYFHRITDNRVGGVATKNMRLFRKICGDAGLSHVLLCTTMWDIVAPSTGEAREHELRDDFWAPMLAAGAGVVNFVLGDEARADGARVG